jgi:hypothetical protein
MDSTAANKWEGRMTDRETPLEEDLELLEYIEHARELEATQQLEAAEFIPEEDRIEAEHTAEPGSGETQEAPIQLIADEEARRKYWQAQALVELEQSEFAAALELNDNSRLRNAYYRLAVYHGRTIYILRSAIGSGKDPLAQAAMRNLATLHRAMVQMHRKAPAVVPVALVLDKQGREALARDLVVRSLQESGEPLPLESIVERVNDLHVLGVAKAAVQRQLKELVSSGYAEIADHQPVCYIRSARAYTDGYQRSQPAGSGRQRAVCPVGGDRICRFE